jgi:hypothetical protein
MHDEPILFGFKKWIKMSRFRLPTFVPEPLLYPLCDFFYLTPKANRSAFSSRVAAQVNDILQIPSSRATAEEIGNWFHIDTLHYSSLLLIDIIDKFVGDLR